VLKDVAIEIRGSISSRIIQGIDITLHFNGGGQDVPIELKDLSGKRNEQSIELDEESRISVIREVYAVFPHPGDFWFLIAEKLKEKVGE